MFRPMIAALIAATALVPPAVAQRGDRGDRGQRSESNRGGNEDRGSWRQRNGGDQTSPRSNWRQSQPQQQQVQQAPQQVQQAPRQAPQQQAQGNRGDRSRWQGQQGQGQQFRGNRDRGQWSGQQQAQGQQRPQAQQQAPQQVRNRGDRDGQRWNGNRGQGQQQFSGNRNRGNEWRGNDGRGNNSAWSRNWRSDSRYNWRSRRANDRSRYRLPRYYAPRGYHYGYNRFSIGITLGSLLFSQQYWLNDPFYYGLPPAYGPYRWVRYYNDALLVDIRTGMVVDVEYDIFW